MLRGDCCSSRGEAEKSPDAGGVLEQQPWSGPSSGGDGNGVGLCVGHDGGGT